MKYLITCKEGFEKILAGEAALSEGKLLSKGRGWIMAEWPQSRGSNLRVAAFPDLCFGETILENPAPFSASSVNALADTCAELWMEHITEIRIDRPWFYLFFSSEETFTRRANIVEKNWLNTIRKKMSRVAKLSRQGIPHGTRSAEGFFVHFTNFDQGFVSFRAASGGQQRMLMDTLAPSRSYLKIEEAFHIFGRAPAKGESVIDLGAAPGGWSWSALKRGAWVTAVDNGPLKGAVNTHPNITHLTVDAFSFQPEEPVDWLLCDMLEQPDMILNLLQKWLNRKWCRSFVVNLKVGRTDPVAILKKIYDPDKGLAQMCKLLCIKQLHHDREEITLMGQIKT